jgi:hypothetical protein
MTSSLGDEESTLLYPLTGNELVFIFSRNKSFSPLKSRTSSLLRLCLLGLCTSQSDVNFLRN